MAYLALLLLIGFVFKSFIFINGENTLFYYILQLFAAVIIFSFNFKKEYFVPPLLRILLIYLIFLAIGRSADEVFYIMLYVVSLLLFVVVLPQVAFDDGKIFKLFSRFGILIFCISFLTLFIQHIGFDNDSGRYRGFFVSVAYASNFFPFFTVLFLNGNNGISKRRSMLLIILGIIFTFLTFSKGSIVVLLVTILFFAFKSKLLSKFHKYLTFILAFFFILGSQNYSDRFFRHDISDDGLFGNRTLNWLVASDAIAGNLIMGKSFIFKYTEGGTRTIETSDRGSESRSSYNGAYDPHSMFLLWMVQGGIIYTILMMTILFSPFYFLWKLNLYNIIDFYICVWLTIMLFAGGDFSSFGNYFEKVLLFFTGRAFYKIYLHKINK